jgi:hypothetical protein
MALEGDSTALAKAIFVENDCEEVNPDIPDQAHHLLSSNVVIALDFEFRSSAGKLMANAAEYQLNAASNGILLPTHFGHQRKLKLQRHCGNHTDEYYDNVERVLRKIYERYEDKDVCEDPAKTNFLKAFEGAENTVRSNIKRRVWWLYDWSKPLWDGDYRDEGTGNLESGRPPDISYEAGLEWLEEKKDDIKRRYITQNRKGKDVKLVRAKWYTNHNYPKPSSINS